MTLQESIDLINSMQYRPGWTWTAEDYSKRFEATVKVMVMYGAYMTEEAYAREGYPVYKEDIRASFCLSIRETDTEEVILRMLFDKLMEIEEHEAREFFRRKSDMWAPFHPHKLESMTRYGKFGTDITFGIA